MDDSTAHFLVGATDKGDGLLGNSVVSQQFTQCLSAVDKHGGTDRDVTAKIGKARGAFVMLKNGWASKQISIDKNSLL